MGSVFSAGKGVSSVDARYATTIDIKEVLSNTRHGDFHTFVADVVKSFDTIDRDILDCASGRLGLPAWFRKVYFSFHREVRLRFKLAAGLGVAWAGDGGTPPRMPSQHGFYCCAARSMVPPLGKPQRFIAPACTVSYVKVVGQEASSSKCVLLSTSRAARRRMTAWRNENEGCFWAVKLDVRDLGGHIDVSLRALAGTLRSRVKIATTQVISVGTLPMGFQRMLGRVCSKYLPGGLHGCEGAAISVSELSVFRAAVARAVWSKKLPMTNTPALLSLLDGPWGSDPAFFIIWSRFRQQAR